MIAPTSIKTTKYILEITEMVEEFSDCRNAGQLITEYQS